MIQWAIDTTTPNHDAITLIASSLQTKIADKYSA